MRQHLRPQETISFYPLGAWPGGSIIFVRGASLFRESQDLTGRGASCGVFRRAFFGRQNNNWSCVCVYFLQCLSFQHQTLYTAQAFQVTESPRVRSHGFFQPTRASTGTGRPSYPDRRRPGVEQRQSGGQTGTPSSPPLAGPSGDGSNLDFVGTRRAQHDGGYLSSYPCG